MEEPVPRKLRVNISRRLLNLARDSRAALIVTILAGGMGGLLTIGQARTLSLTVARVFLDGQALHQVRPLLEGLLWIIAGRSLLVWVGEVSARTVAIRVKDDLRRQLFGHILKLGPAYTRRERTGALTAAATEGIEALDAYFSQYLPQLALAAIVPLSILVFVFPLDPLSGLILLITAPLIPVFMILIGKAAETLTNRQYQTLSRLSAHFLDSLQGLTTLKIFGRSKSHASTIEQASEQFRKTTMSVLRVTFLSAFVLELAATLSTAVIAVEVGLRLLYARMTFEQAFFLLILAPEFYLPLRMLGLRFHAGMSGTSAARKIFEILDQPVGRGQVPDVKVRTPSSNPGPQSFPANQPPRICLDRVSYTYPGETSPALQDIGLTIQPGQHIALVGESGSGKSTLIQLLLGFISPDQGQIWVDGQPLEEILPEDWREAIAWVPQKPFIFNTSIADNIRLGEPGAGMGAVRAAARAAHLEDFVDSLPEGYQAIVGEAGSRLSGGEAQRLALGRAFLKDAPILILDEPTSYLDPVLESQLAASTQNLIACSGKERTIVTIAHRTNTVRQADQIIVLKDGRIVERGSHETLLAQGGEYAEMVQPQIDARLAKKNHPPDPQITPPANPLPANPPLANLPPANLPPATLPRLLAFLRGSWGRVAVSALIGTGTILSSLGLIGASSWLISAAALHPSVAELQIAIVGVRFFGISRAVFRYFERLISHDVTFRLLSRLRTWFYRAIEPLAPARLMRYRSGDLLSRVGADVDALENFYIRGISPVVVAALVSLGAAAYLGRFSARLGIGLLAFLSAAGVAAPLLIRFISRQPGQKLVDCRSRMQAQLVESIQGLADLLMFGRASDHQKRISQIGAEYRLAQQKMARITGFHSGLSLFLSNLGMWVILGFGIQAVSAGQIPGLMLAALTMIALASFEAVAPLPLAAQTLGETTESAGRLFELVDTTPEIPETGGMKLGQNHPLEIEFSSLSFTYPKESAPALEDISFEIPAGRSVAIVGPSGAGKSTLLHLLLRFWEYHTGEIFIGGHSLRGFAPDDLRAQVAVVPQRPYLFNASLRENIRLGCPKAGLCAIEAAARLAQVHGFISGLPDGYDTFVGEQGLRLSGGEQQRLAIARALLEDAPLLILDEPTANLDPLSEHRVLDAVFGWAQCKTAQGQPRSVLLITHRLIGLENVDQIIVLDSGRIVERGTQAELLRANKLFARLYGLQNQVLLA